MLTLVASRTYESNRNNDVKKKVQYDPKTKICIVLHFALASDWVIYYFH